MKKILMLLGMFMFVLTTSACTKQVVFLNTDVTTVKHNFDNFVKSTGYTYRLKDDVSNIYNVHITEFNMQYLLQSKPMYTEEIGFTCKFKGVNQKDVLMDCKTYGGERGYYEVKRHLKEQKWDNVQFVSYKKYKKENL